MGILTQIENQDVVQKMSFFKFYTEVYPTRTDARVTDFSFRGESYPQQVLRYG